MSDKPEIPHRRHVLTLKLEADTIEDLEAALTNIGLQLLIDDNRGRDWADKVHITSGGYTSSHTLEMTSDLSITGDDYRASLKDWSEQQKAARKAAKS